MTDVHGMITDSNAGRAMLADSPNFSSHAGGLLFRVFPRIFLAISFLFPSIVRPTSGAEDDKGASGIPSVVYRNDRQSNGPWSIHVIRIDRSRADVELHSTLAREAVVGLATLAQQVRGFPSAFGKPLGALNGDFYEVGRGPYIGDPRGLQILRGELVSAPTDQASFWIDSSGAPQMTNVTSRLRVTWPNGARRPLGLNEERSSREVVLYTPRLGGSTRTTGGRELILEKVEDGPWLPLRPGVTFRGKVGGVRYTGNTPLRGEIMVLSLGSALTNSIAVELGDVLTISTETSPGLAGVQMAISGGWVLVRGGKLVKIDVPNDSGAYKYRSVFERHPRSAIGANNKYIFLVEVDGRQRDLSVGMNLREMAKYMLELGCDTAINLDGGASATMWYAGRVVNQPSSGRDRDIANGIVVVQKPELASR